MTVCSFQEPLLVLLVLLELFHSACCSESCYKAFTSDKNGLSFTVSGVTYTNLTGVSVSGETVTVKCTNSYQTFTNEVKLIPGVSSYTIYNTGAFTTKCSNKGVWSPNIRESHNLDGSLANTDMTYMCAVGCALIQSKTHLVSYGSGMLSHERWSPPVLPSRYEEAPVMAEISCREGYTAAVGDYGHTETYCNNGTWTPSNSYITCVKGCSDITDSITWASTTTAPSSESGEAPFGPGDVVSFTCEQGFVLVGESSLTCKGDTVWSDDLPSCVYVENSRKKRQVNSSSRRGHRLAFLACLLAQRLSW